MPLLNMSDITGKHEDERRTLTPFFNGEFTASQIKIAHMKKDAKLWWHYHTYAELFTVLSGEAIFRVLNLDDPQKEISEFILIPWKKLYIPANHPHEASVKGGTILLWATQESYISPEHNDKPYTFHTPKL